ncbi:hypothetical protein MLPF_0618 [Mycobacterium lepromatosis]|nr:hypothetical protein MLPF_0618 [Mycobacterium lepromatosis]
MPNLPIVTAVVRRENIVIWLAAKPPAATAITGTRRNERRAKLPVILDSRQANKRERKTPNNSTSMTARGRYH